MLSLQDKYIYHKSTQNITNSLQIIVSPLISHNLWKVYAVPKILYGLEVMPIKKKEMEQMEIMQRKLLRQLQCLSNQVANTAVYVLIGAVPIYMMIERNMLSLLMNIIRNNTTVEYQILMRQLAMRNEKDHTFINRIQEVIQKYKLEPVEKLMEQPKSKEEWKRIVKSHQNIYWHERCKADQLEKKSLKYLQIQDRPISKPHNIWQSTGNDPISIKSGEVKSKLVTQSYMLQNIKSRYMYNKNISSICTLCETVDENIIITCWSVLV